MWNPQGCHARFVQAQDVNAGAVRLRKLCMGLPSHSGPLQHGEQQREGARRPRAGSQRCAELQASCGLQVAEPGEVDLSLGPVGTLGTLVGSEPCRVGEVWTRQDQCGKTWTDTVAVAMEDIVLIIFADTNKCVPSRHSDSNNLKVNEL